MIIIIENQTAGTLSYLGGLVTVSANTNLTVPSQYLYPIAKDSGLINDCLQANVLLSDGFQTYSSVGATAYLNTVATSIGGAVVGLVGSPVPSYIIFVGGKDPNGNVVAGSFDANGNLKVNSVGDAITPASPTFATIGVSSAQALASNTNRKGLILVNTSTAKIYLGLGATAVVGSGITLYPGGSWVMDEFNFTITAINAIASAASSNMTIQEFST